MANKQCLINLDELAGRKLSIKETKSLVTQVEKWIAKHELEGKAIDLQAKVLEDANKFAVSLEAAAQIEKRNANLNALSKIQNEQYILSVWGDDPAQGLRAILAESLSDRHGSRNGLTARISSLRDEINQGITSDLSKADLADMASSGDFDKGVAKAMHLLNKEVVDEAAISKLPPNEVEMARVYLKYSELARNKANKAGAWIKKLDGRFAKRSHDGAKISKAAGSHIPTGDPRHKKAWIKRVEETVDWEKTMPDVAPKNRQSTLASMYEQFSNGFHLNFKDAPSPGFKGALSIGKNLSQERVLHFKDFEAEWEYYKDFSRGETIFDNLLHETGTIARDTAIMEKLGPNAEANLDDMVSTLAKRYTNAGEGVKAKQLLDEHRRLKSQLWPAITEEMNIPENETFAKWSQITRSIQAVGDLAGAVLSSLSDVAFYGSTMRYFGQRNTGDMFSGMREAVQGIFSDFRHLTPDVQELASELGIMLETMIPHASRYDADINNPGDISRWTQRLMKMNLLSAWQDRIRLTSVVMTAHRHALNAGKGFGELSEGMQAAFRQFGIEDFEWDMIRSQKAKVDSSGRQLFTVETINQIPDSALDSYANIASKIKEKKSPKIIQGLRDKARAELKTKYRNYFSEIGKMAATEPGKIERAFMLRGTKRGTVQGEMLRHFWMYKSFTVSVMRKHLGRELHGYHPDKVSNTKALMRLFTDTVNDRKISSGLGGMVNLMAMSTLTGYAAMSLKDISKGKEPRIPENSEQALKVFLASASQGGAMGIYGDFLFGEMKSRFGHGPIETILGPSAGRGADIINLFKRFREGDDFAGKSALFLLNNTPGLNTARNLAYTRWIMDYLITYRLQELMNPGYLGRMERRLSKEKNQEYISLGPIQPPSEMIPRGGF